MMVDRFEDINISDTGSYYLISYIISYEYIIGN